MKVASVTGYVPLYLTGDSGSSSEDPATLSRGLSALGAAGGVFRGLGEFAPSVVNASVGIPAGLINGALHGIAGGGWEGMKDGFMDSVKFSDDYFAQPIRDKQNQLLSPFIDMYRQDVERQRERLKSSIRSKYPEDFVEFSDGEKVHRVDIPGTRSNGQYAEAVSRANAIEDGVALGTNIITSAPAVGGAWKALGGTLLRYAPQAVSSATSAVAKHAPAVYNAASKVVKPMGAAISKAKGYMSGKAKPILGAAMAGASWMGRQVDKIPQIIRTAANVAGRTAVSIPAMGATVGTTRYLNDMSDANEYWHEMKDKFQGKYPELYEPDGPTAEELGLPDTMRPRPLDTWTPGNKPVIPSKPWLTVDLGGNGMN